MCTDMDFAYRETIQAANFFAIKSGGRISKIKVLKLIYLADRDHLRRHGRTITNDEYYAMQYGPVASATKDMLQLDESGGTKEPHYASKYLSLQQKHMIKSIRDFDDSLFSESEIESLERVFDKFGGYEGFDLAKRVTHEFPEWKSHAAALRHASRVKMDIKDMLLDAPREFETHPLSPEKQKAMRVVIRESEDFRAAFGR